MEDTCICCGEPVPEGCQTCWKCEQAALKAGKIFQNNKASKEEIDKGYEFLYWKG